MTFRQDLRSFFQSKTNWTGITMIGSSLVGFYSGSMDGPTAFQTGMTGLGMMFIKDAVS